MQKQQESSNIKIKPIFYIFPFLLIFLLFFLPPIDTDLGWHLRYGNYFLKTGEILKENIFTYYLANYKWANSYSLYQILTAIIYKISGLFGLSLAYAILITGTFYLYNKIHLQMRKINFLSFLLISLLSWNVFHLGWRAQVFSFFFFILDFLLLKKTQSYSKSLFIIPFTFIFWVNFHGAFILGLFLIISYLLNLIWQKEYKKAQKISIILILSFVATLINPFGLKIYGEVIRHIQVPMYKLIAEWVQPTTLTKILLTIISVTSILLIFKSKSKKKVFFTSLIIAFTYLAIRARRNYPFYWLITLLSIKESLEKKLISLQENLIFKKIINYIYFLCFIIGIIINIPKTFKIDFDRITYCNEGTLPYPYKAINFIKKEKIPGKNVYSSYEWGGFLEWQLPEYKFFTDGRMPTWKTASGKSPYTTYLEIIQARPDYQKTLEKYKTNWLLIGNGTFLDIKLQKDKGYWQEVYRDKISAVYIRK